MTRPADAGEGDDEMATTNWSNRIGDEFGNGTDAAMPAEFHAANGLSGEELAEQAPRIAASWLPVYDRLLRATPVDAGNADVYWRAYNRLEFVQWFAPQTVGSAGAKRAAECLRDAYHATAAMIVHHGAK